MPNLGQREREYLLDAYDSSWISSSGEYIERFEKSFSSYQDSGYGISTSNGTTALHLALLALSIKKGDEVIVPDLTFVATINAVLYVGATPVIVDVSSINGCIDPNLIKEKISRNTKAIICVHLFGNLCEMDKIQEIAKNNNLFVVEDCAQAHGATYNDKKVGSFGDIGCFSFYGNKIITTGEGGMCVTDNVNYANKMKVLRDHGMDQRKRYWHNDIGYNYRMTNIQAAIGLAQLERIDNILQNRSKHDEIHRKFFSTNSVLRFINSQSRGSVTWLTTIMIADSINKKRIIDQLTNKNIEVRRLFYPLSDMPIYRKFCNENTSISHAMAEQGISLPTYSDLNKINEYKKNLNKL